MKFSSVTSNIQTGTYCRGLQSLFLYKLTMHMWCFRAEFYQTKFRKSKDSKCTFPPGTYSSRCCI